MVFIVLFLIHFTLYKEVVVYVHNEILPSHKKERTQVSSNEVDEPRTYYTE